MLNTHLKQMQIYNPHYLSFVYYILFLFCAFLIICNRTTKNFTLSLYTYSKYRPLVVMYLQDQCWTSEIDNSPLHVNLSVDLVLTGYFESRELFWMRKLDAKRQKLLSVQVGVGFFVMPLLMIEKAQNKKNNNLVCKAEVIRILDRYFFQVHEVFTW